MVPVRRQPRVWRPLDYVLTRRASLIVRVKNVDRMDAVASVASAQKAVYVPRIIFVKAVLLMLPMVPTRPMTVETVRVLPLGPPALSSAPLAQYPNIMGSASKMRPRMSVVMPGLRVSNLQVVLR